MKGTTGVIGRWVGVVLVLWLVPGMARAQSPEVRKYLNAAANMYENLEYEKALQQIERARKKATTAADDAAIALYQGIVLSDMGKEEKALTAFKTGLSFDPDAKLPLDVSPKVEAIFERARASVKKLLGPQLARQEEEERKRKEAEEREAAERERLERQRLEAERNRVASVGPEARTSTVAGHEAGVTGTASRPSARGYAWIPAVGGVVAAGVGTAVLFKAKSDYDSLINGTAPGSQAASIRDGGKVEQTVGLALLGVGAAGVVAAGVMFFTGGGEAPHVSAWVSPGNAYVSVSGSLPWEPREKK